MTKSISPISSNQEQQHENDPSEDRNPLSDQIKNLISPNRQHQQQSSSPPPRISTPSSMLSGSEYSGSFTSNCSAEFSSEGTGTMNHHSDDNPELLNSVGISTSNSKRALLNSNFFDNQFGGGLLNNIHKMQSLLEEYQTSLTSLEFEKADKQHEIDTLEKRLKAKGETEERYKEEIWNLEYKNQELQQKFENLSLNYSKSKLERTRLARVETSLTQEFENLKAAQQSWQRKLEEAKDEHEAEILSLKRSLHTIKLEKESLAKQIQELTVPPAIAIANPNILHAVSNEEKIESSEKNEATKLAPTSSQSTKTILLENSNSLNIVTEIQTLKKSLDYAHKIIDTMQVKMDKEREERLEVDKLLRDAQETIENYNTFSQNNSTQWYPVSSPTQSVHSNGCPNNANNFLSPTSASSFNHDHTYHQPHNDQQSSKLNSGLCSAKSCRRKFADANTKSPYRTRGKSLCDELSLAGSVGNFAPSITELIPEEKINVDDRISLSFPVLAIQTENNSSPVAILNDQQGVNRIDKSNIQLRALTKKVHPGIEINSETMEHQSVKENLIAAPAIELNFVELPAISQSTQENLVTAPIVELTFVDLPSISNHEIYSSFSTHSSFNNSGEEDDNYSEEIKIVVQQQNTEHYGSLLKKPESYIYKSRRELEEEIKRQKKASTSALIASSTADSILNSRIGFSDKMDRRRESIDDKSVSALTRTMIGDWMWKYTRKVVGSGISENKHRRFFWIHPYTQTLYWSSQEPGTNSRQSNTKSVLVESFVVLDDDNDKDENSAPSILIKTPSRGLKIQCMNIIAHNAWINSLNFLLDKSNIKNEIVPKLSSLGNVSKQHYIDRKMSIKKQTTKNDDSKPKDNYERDTSFKFIAPLPLAIDDLMSPPSPTVFTMQT